MRRVLLIISLFCLTAIAGNAQRKRAFMVGISHYDTALTGYQWNNIHGAEDVRLLSPILKKQGFDLTILTDEQATFENITNQMSQFINKTRKGDIVYIHFSTHGQPVEDLNGDEEDGWDEAIVPIDAYKLYKKGVYEGKKHLIDDKLNKYVNKLREKIGPAGFLYVIIDACHAGRAYKGMDDNIRGTRVGFTYNNKIYKPSPQKQTYYKVDFSPQMAHVLFIEACRPDQVNMEIKVGDKLYGPLSFNISQALSSHSLSTDAEGFLNKVKASILNNGHWPNNQNMVTEKSF